MVSALDSVSNGPGLNPGRGTALSKHFTVTLIVPLFIQAPVVQRVDNAIHRINRYPADKCWQNKPRYPLDSDLSVG